MITRWRSCSDVTKKPGSFYIPASPALACGLHPHDGKTVAASLGSECIFQAGRQKNFLSNLGFLFGKESPLLGLSVCILLTKLCQMATPNCKGLWKLVSSVSSLPYRERQGRSGLGWFISQSTVFVKMCYKFLFLKAINLEFDT